VGNPGGRCLRAAVIAIVVTIAPSAYAQPDAAPAPPPDAAPAVEPPDAASAVESTPDAALAPDAAAAEPPAIIAEPSAASPATVPGSGLGAIQIHGFVSEGGFVSTDNDYIGKSSRGSLELFEAGINFSTEVADRLRAGVQLFTRDFGEFDDGLHVDWAFLDYQWRPWLGLRAGIIKMPFGLYNEYTDIDAGRLPILMPQGVYPFRNRDVLLAHRGFALYGNHELGAGGAVEYQAWLGTLSIPENALTVSGGTTLDEIDAKYVTGAQLYWQPPVDGLRIGGTFLRASIDFRLTLPPAVVQQLIDAGLVPPDYDGTLVVSQRPDTWIVGSVEYIRGDWLFAAEYTRAFKHQQSTLPALSPTIDEDAERFYGMVTRRLSSWLEIGTYYSVHHLDANDRRGRDPKWPERHYAWQRDLAATVRFDVNDHWLWKLEAHFIDGTGDLAPLTNPERARYWGLFLFRTTVTF
jgi:hypothetical protein